MIVTEQVETPDLRSFLKTIESEHPEYILRIKKEVDLRFEVTVVQEKLDKLHKFPIVIFENVKNIHGEKSKFPLITNVFASRFLCARSMNTTPERVGLEYQQRSKKPIAPIVVDKKEAPVKDVITRGADVDLFNLPAPWHHEMDLGYWILASAVTTVDKETSKIYDCAYQRILVRERRRAPVSLAPNTHNYIRLLQSESQNEPMPVIVWIGHHPSYCLGSLTRVPIDVNEYSIMGAVAGKSLRVVPSETFGDRMMVPADAEIVIEGVINPKVREVDGPFSDYTLYMENQKLNPVIEVTAITHRKDAYFMDINIAGRDLHVMGSIPMEGGIYEAVKTAVPTVKNVHIPPSGLGRFHAYIQIKKTHPGQGRDAISAALPCDARLKHVFVVDEDVDIFDENEVMWAIATRSQWDRDCIIISRMVGGSLDPSAYPILVGPKANKVTAKAGIDATKPIDVPYEVRAVNPPEVVNKVNLADLVGEERLNSLRFEV